MRVDTGSANLQVCTESNALARGVQTSRFAQSPSRCAGSANLQACTESNALRGEFLRQGLRVQSGAFALPPRSAEIPRDRYGASSKPTNGSMSNAFTAPSPSMSARITAQFGYCEAYCPGFSSASVNGSMSNASIAPSQFMSPTV